MWKVRGWSNQSVLQLDRIRFIEKRLNQAPRPCASVSDRSALCRKKSNNTHLFVWFDLTCFGMETQQTTHPCKSGFRTRCCPQQLYNCELVASHWPSPNENLSRAANAPPDVHSSPTLERRLSTGKLQLPKQFATDARKDPQSNLLLQTNFLTKDSCVLSL